MKRGVERVGMAIAIIGATTLGSACEARPDSRITPRSVPIATPVIRPPDPAATIVVPGNPQLDQVMQPVISLQESNIDPSSQEFIRAITNFYCLRTICDRTPSELAKSISFVDPNTFIEELQILVGRTFTSEEQEKQLRDHIEFITDDGRILINTQGMDGIVEHMQRQQPEIVRAAGRRNLRNITTTSVMIHAFTHINENKDVYTFDPFSAIVYGNRIPEIGTLKGFTFNMVRDDGTPVYVTGANEAVTEYAAIIIGRPLGHLSVVPNYRLGVDIISQVNQQARISEEEFLAIVRGDMSQGILLRRWGALRLQAQPDEKAAVQALFMIGLGVQGALSEQDTVSSVNQLLRPPRPIRLSTPSR